jgi:Domain of unknown function (DUF4326)
MIVTHAISLYRPWSYATAHLGKDRENREWYCDLPVGTWIGIYATKTWSEDGASWITQRGLGEVPDEVDCHQGLVAIAKFGGNIFADDGSPWFMGPIAFVWEDCLPIEPLACEEGKRIWEIPSDLLGPLAERCAAALLRRAESSQHPLPVLNRGDLVKRVKPRSNGRLPVLGRVGIPNQGGYVTFALCDANGQVIQQPGTVDEPIIDFAHRSELILIEKASKPQIGKVEVIQAPFPRRMYALSDWLPVLNRGDLVKTVEPRSNGRPPVWGRVGLPNQDGYVTFAICDANGQIIQEPGTVGGPIIDFAHRSELILIDKALKPQLGKVEVINIKDLPSGRLRLIRNSSDFFYIGRQYSDFKASPLANPFAIAGQYTRDEACDLFESHVLRPAMANRQGAFWSSLSKLADQVLSGESLTLGCWCEPARCHGHSLRDAIQTIAEERSAQDDFL